MAPKAKPPAKGKKGAKGKGKDAKGTASSKPYVESKPPEPAKPPINPLAAPRREYLTMFLEELKVDQPISDSIIA